MSEYCILTIRFKPDVSVEDAMDFVIQNLYMENTKFIDGMTSMFAKDEKAYQEAKDLLKSWSESNRKRE